MRRAPASRRQDRIAIRVAVQASLDAGPDQGLEIGRPSGMGGRVVEGSGLENRQARKGLVGSNPTPSARFFV